MTDNPSNSTPEGNLAAEFRQLAKSLVDVMQAAWDQPERKRLQQEVVNGLNELGTTLKDETRKFSESPTGQRLKTDVGNIGQRVQSGEVEARVRQELLNALRIANEQIQQAADRLNERGTPDLKAYRPVSGSTSSGASGGAGSGESGSAASSGAGSVANPDKGTDRSSMDPAGLEHQEVNPDDMSAPPSDTGHREIHPDDV